MRSHAKASSAGSTEGSGNVRGLFRRAFAIRGASSEAGGSGARSSRLLLPAVVSAVLLTGVFGAGQAIGFDRYVSAGIMAPGEFNAPTKLAVDDATGNVLVVDSGANKVQVWSPGGVSATLLTAFGEGDLSAPYGIAIDQSNGDVYVSDAGNNRIVRYATDGQPTPTYTLDPSFTSPASGPDAAAGQVGSFASPLAVDPANGNLLVADTGNEEVTRFDASGGFIASFDGAVSEGGKFRQLEDIVVGAGITYVADATAQANPTTGSPPQGTRVTMFDAEGAPVGSIPSTDTGVTTSRNLAFGTSSGRLFMTEQGQHFGSVPSAMLHVYSGENVFQVTPYSAMGPFSSAPGLAVDDGSPSASGRVYGLIGSGYFSLGSTGIEVFDLHQVPDMSVLSATDLTETSLRLHGTVNPLGRSATSYRFEYSSDGSIWTPTPEELLSEPEVGGVPTPSEDPLEVFADVSGLAPNTVYKVRLVASNGEGSNTSDPVAMSPTLLPRPATVTGKVSDRGTTTAVLHGTVNPFGAQATYRFEYGTTTAYGFQVPADGKAVAGSGRVPTFVGQEATGLQPGTTYHYRLVAENTSGTALGADRTFTTVAADAPSRGYELVSPPDKEGNHVNGESFQFKAAADGNSLSFTGQTVLGSGSAESSPLFPRYVSHRSEDSWSTRPVDPPGGPAAGFGWGHWQLTIAVSRDNTKAVVMSSEALAPGAVEGASITYLRDVATGGYTTISTIPGLNFLYNQTVLKYSVPTQFYYGSRDFSRVYLRGAGVSFLSGVPKEALYEFHDGQLHVVSLDPDGTTVPTAGPSLSDREMNRLSEDGSHLFFGEPSGPVYVRIDDSVTQVISESHRAADLGTLEPGRFAGASRDGSIAYVLSRDLTEDSQPGVESLYRYEVATEKLTLIGATESLGGVYQVSASGGTVYFQSTVELAPGATAGMPNVYVWRDGDLSLVATISYTQGAPFSFLGGWSNSPNGRYFAFATDAELTGEPASRPVYLYDADAKTLACASCRPDGRPSGRASIGSPEIFDEDADEQIPKAVTDRGQVFFDTADSLVSLDTNSVRDVYEFVDGEPRLVSSGHGVGSELAGVSASGDDVFFTTKDRLVGIDNDNANDVYDARVGGGLASQNPPPRREECIRDDCKATPSQGPELPFGGSEGLNGPENVREAPSVRCGKGRHARKVKGKTRCVKQEKGKKKNRTNGNRRNGR